MKKNPEPRLIDALSARTHFGEVMQEAEKNNQRFLVSRRGKPKVVIMSVEDYLRNVIKQPEILAKIQLGAKKAGLDTLTDEEIDDEIKSYRQSKKRKKSK